MKTSDAVRMLQGIQSRAYAAVLKAERQSVAIELKEARKASSGPLKEPDLRRLDRPFARRHKVSLIDSETINVQSGEFRRSWAKSGPTRTGNSIWSRAYNTDSKAKHMAGTHRMLPRPIIARVKRNIRADRVRRVRVAFKNSISTNS